MQKIKYSVLERMIAARLTSKEIDFLIYISRFQSDYGYVSGVHYKEVCESMGMSYQGFYDVKTSLEEKGFICTGKSNRIDHDITILGNVIASAEDAKEGYIDTSHHIFDMEEFFAMKAGAKLLAMHMMKVTMAGKGSFQIGVDKFFDSFPKRFGVSKRVMRAYLMQIKTFFAVGIKDKKYFVTPRKIVYRKPGQASDQERINRHDVEVICRRNRIKESDKKEVEDVSHLLKQYKYDAQNVQRDVLEVLRTSIERSLEALNISQKIINKVLKPKLIHKIMRQELGLA